MPSCLPRFLLLIGLVFGGVGCETTAPGRVVEAAPQVRLMVRNLTGHGWRLVVRSGDGATLRTAEVGPREMVRIALAGGGSYEIEQTLMGAGSAEVATRRFPARFEAGQEYEWSLATVVSEVETPAGAPAGTEAAARE